jgi:hypothetical protein
MNSKNTGELTWRAKPAAANVNATRQKMAEPGTVE